MQVSLMYYPAYGEEVGCSELLEKIYTVPLGPSFSDGAASTVSDFQGHVCSLQSAKWRNTNLK